MVIGPLAVIDATGTGVTVTTPTADVEVQPLDPVNVTE